MNLIGQELWDRLGQGRARGDVLNVRPVAPEQIDRLFVAIDARDLRHILIKLIDSDETLDDRQTRGMYITTRELTRELAGTAHVPGRYLDLVCQDLDGHPIFDLIGNEIADRLHSKSEPAPVTVSKVVAKWRHFWTRVSRTVLTQQEQLGLFGELWFLKVWLGERMPLAEALKRWYGPLGARHDFAWTGGAVEVKTTLSRAPVHRVNGVEQLMPPAGGDLLLFSLRVCDDPHSANTLPFLIKECKRCVVDDPDAASALENRLAYSHYTSSHETEYEKLHLRVIGEGLYRVVEDFPRVVPPSFPTGLPVGVNRIEYDIDLTAFGHLRIASRSTDSFAL